MALVGLPGSKRIYIGPNILLPGVPVAINSVLDAAKEAVIMIGQIETSDGGSHTIDTTGSSSMFWRASTVTFANASTTVKVGIAAIDTAAGPPGRAVNVAGVITFDVSKTMIGGSGGITTDAAQNHVPDAGSKTIANGDLVAFCIQMTARAGVDVVQVAINDLYSTITPYPFVTLVSSAGAFTANATIPNMFITFSDGATGWFFGAEVFSTFSSVLWNSGSASKEYGQLYSLPFPLTVYGIYGWVNPQQNFDMVLYSDPLGTPVAERTVSIDASTVYSATGRRFQSLFSSPYDVAPNQQIAAIFKPGASSITAYYKILHAAGQRIADPWGTDGYAISRSSGAFGFTSGLNELVNLYAGLIAGAFNEEASASIMGGSVIS